MLDFLDLRRTNKDLKKSIQKTIRDSVGSTFGIAKGTLKNQ